MDFIIGIILLFIIGLILCIPYAIYLAVTADKRKDAYFAKLRDEAFNGERESVTVEWTPFKGGTQADLLELADEQGYRVATSLDEKNKTALLFERL